ncbi:MULTISPECIES: gliding motility-associated C-terminal domain-containing protein [unclassified Chryseobacterium]|jgi:gliding motility-associated-like protein|uniref:T9SS type B sorting domain-containing protein n=1 Tax=unclassified Chryseobacterium TaxID=2593645 RepID=UPI000E2271BA|nr:MULTISPECIES: gliding motility-associated C-terminal domain-containing protein [unclassified Chryseobacterium]REC43890.1 gliding motility-associated C-terminal domain-containing protein [Chryseobacterium sp. 5_R23647]
MKRFLLSLALILGMFTSLFAQRDTEHWIAPFYASSSTTQAIYLSTDSVTPFDVTITSKSSTAPGNVVGVVTISKGDPKVFTIPSANISVNTAANAFNIIDRGLYLKGAKPFFCTLRLVQSTTHGEILTSKGKAGTGKEFYVVATPSNATSSNFTAGVMATEDNTVVTTTWNAAVTFIGGAPTTTTNTFTLNKGDSFIYAGLAGASGQNINNFIGAKIVANKPITLTNGNVNGNFGNVTSGGSDIILDQSVPVERLGSTFAMVRTRSSSADLEGGIIVATENNTEVFLNGSGTSVATLNQGQMYRISGTDYVAQGTSGHFNMFITTSKNVYLYQLVSILNQNETGGFNYIPPLNCFLPRKIDELPKIDEMPTGTGGTSVVPMASQNIKLNIITEAGATVTYTTNGGAPITPTAAQGPFPLNGSTAWVTYGLEMMSGNLTIVSNKAVTAGINGGYSTSGYGGYFAGFSSIPIIAKQVGECIPGIILEVDDSYETYQWYLNNAPIAGATSHTITPAVAGNYTVKVTMGTCPPVTTPIYKVFACLSQTSQNINICGTKAIVPTFTNSTQTPVPGTVQIITQPTNGTATLNPATGVITYIPNAGYLGPDKIVYKFCGNATEFIDCEQITLNLNVVPFVLTDRTIYACQYAGNGFFDLTTANVTDNAIPTTKKFYPTLADLNANTNQITNPTNYFSGLGSVYVRVLTAEGCVGNAKITLDFFPTPVVKEATLTECFIENNETKGRFNLVSANVTSEAPVTKKFFPTSTDASNGTNEIVGVDAYISANGSVYARVFNSNGCYAIAKINLKVTAPKRSPLLVDKYICIDDRTTLDAGPGYQSYRWSTGATTQSIVGVAVGDYWVILQDSGCSVKQLVSVKKAQDPVITSIEIANNTATVIVTGGIAPYKFSVDGVTWQDSNVFTNLTRGQHTFYVKDSFNCTPISVEVTVPNLVNAITPNGDNVNDYIDYRELAYKDNLTFVIYDRYGNKIFTGDKSNNYRWDGTHSNKKILTGTYWYHINWNEPNEAKTPIKYTGWILVKNRE